MPTITIQLTEEEYWKILAALDSASVGMERASFPASAEAFRNLRSNLIQQRAAIIAKEEVGR